MGDITTTKEDTFVGRSDDYRLCQVCGKNASIKEIAGRCQYPSCGLWVCDDCAMKCAHCNKIYCPNHARVVEGKKACHHCKPLSKCFIATAAYGTPYAEEINILRYWRDTYLETNDVGSAFVSFYYKISPPVANFIRDKVLLRSLVRLSLYPIIRLLKLNYSERR